MHEANIVVHLSLLASHSLIVRKGEMMQVISNLIANAIQAMPAGGTLSIETLDSEIGGEPAIRLTIADTGVGIPEEHLDRIFDAFFTTRSPVGTGIGLFVARQFVEDHGGTMRVESSTGALSHGTKMSVLLPLSRATFASRV